MLFSIHERLPFMLNWFKARITTCFPRFYRTARYSGQKTTWPNTLPCPYFISIFPFFHSSCMPSFLSFSFCYHSFFLFLSFFLSVIIPFHIILSVFSLIFFLYFSLSLSLSLFLSLLIYVFICILSPNPALHLFAQGFPEECRSCRSHVSLATLVKRFSPD